MKDKGKKPATINHLKITFSIKSTNEIVIAPYLATFHSFNRQSIMDFRSSQKPN